MKTTWAILLASLILFCSCSNENKNEPTNSVSTKLTLFFVNDVHGQIDNFSKVKHIVDAERTTTNVLVASAGDLFSGNPVVDNYAEKGFPIIDIMNEVGFDVATIGNHEFDYGAEALKSRVEQSTFPWVCANAEANNSTVNQPNDFATVVIDDLRITFLGLIETNGSKTAIIPSSHPWRVQDYTFTPAQNVVRDFTSVKSDENADLFIALSHLGHNGNEVTWGDFQLAQNNNFFDLIVGGHSHAIIDTVFNNTPIFQSGGYLNFLGKIELEIMDKTLLSSNFSLINLNNYKEHDLDLLTLIESYNNEPELYEEIGFSEEYHSKSSTGCFYTNAIRAHMQADVCFQNTGGIRKTLDKGTIIKREIYEISPFNNGTVLYEMTVEQIKLFLQGSDSGFYYSGIQIKKAGGAIEIRDELGRKIPDNYLLKVGINDYIAAVHSSYFPENGIIQSLTAAETIIAYLESINTSINYSNCYNYFRY